MLKEFRKANDLTQTEVGDYLGIKKSFISRVENGNVNLPEDKFKKLIENPNGWDTSALTRGVQHVGDSITTHVSAFGSATINNRGGESQSANTAALESKIAVLEEKVKYLEMIVADKDRLIDVLMDKK